MISPLSRVWQQVKLSDVSLGTRPRYSLTADEDVKKLNKHTHTQTKILIGPMQIVYDNSSFMKDHQRGLGIVSGLDSIYF